jgi:hypothetical protein
MLPLDVSVLQQPMLPLDVSVHQQPLLPRGVLVSVLNQTLLPICLFYSSLCCPWTCLFLVFYCKAACAAFVGVTPSIAALCCT